MSSRCFLMNRDTEYYQGDARDVLDGRELAQHDRAAALTEADAGANIPASVATPTAVERTAARGRSPGLLSFHDGGIGWRGQAARGKAADHHRGGRPRGRVHSDRFPRGLGPQPGAEATRLRVEQAIAATGWAVDPAARQLAGGAGDEVVLAIAVAEHREFASDPYYARVIAGAHEETARHGLSLSVHVAPLRSLAWQRPSAAASATWAPSWSTPARRRRNLSAACGPGGLAAAEPVGRRGHRQPRRPGLHQPAVTSWPAVASTRRWPRPPTERAAG